MTFNVSGNMPAALIHGDLDSSPTAPWGLQDMASHVLETRCSRWGASVSKRSLMDWLAHWILQSPSLPPDCDAKGTLLCMESGAWVLDSAQYAPQLLGSSHDLPQPKEFNLRVQPAMVHEPPCQSRDSASSGRMAAEHGAVQWQVMRGFVFLWLLRNSATQDSWK